MSALGLLTRFGLTRPPDGALMQVTLTIDYTKVPANLLNYPLYVDLADLPLGFWASVRSDGGDIRAFTGDGSTELPTDLVSINKGTRTGELHVLVPVVDSTVGTAIRLTFGDPTAARPANAAPNGRDAVWADYVAVYHLNGTGMASEPNAAGGGLDLTPTGSMNTASGPVGTARAFENSRALRATEESSIGEPDTLTIQAWQRDTLASGSNSSIPMTVGTAWFWFTNNPPLGVWGRIRASVSGSAGGVGDRGNNLNDGDWHQVHATHDGTDTRVYVDGALEGSPYAQTIVPANGGTGRSQVILGSNWNNTSYYPPFGTAWMDEARVRFGALPAAWISAEHANQSNPAAFYSVSP